MYNVYRTACKIPYGETKTYKDIACMAGAPKGARAVGKALKKNPLVFSSHVIGLLRSMAWAVLIQALI